MKITFPGTIERPPMTFEIKPLDLTRTYYVGDMACSDDETIFYMMTNSDWMEVVT